METADRVVAIAQAEAGDLPLALDYLPEVDDLWDVCDSEIPQAGEDPESIQWVANRNLIVDPPQEMASQLDAILERLVADGWTLRDDVTSGGGRQAAVVQGGYTVSLGADTEVRVGVPSSMGIHVYGPCIDAPAGIHAVP